MRGGLDYFEVVGRVNTVNGFEFTFPLQRRALAQGLALRGKRILLFDFCKLWIDEVIFGASEIGLFDIHVVE
jgi:hypothetical protein